MSPAAEPAQDLRRLVAAAQVLRPGLAEPAEIDDLLDPGVARRGAEVVRRLAVAGGEVPRAAAAHRVDEVVGDLDALERGRERLGAQDVGLGDLGARRLEVARTRAVAGHRAHAYAAAQQLARQLSPDVARRPRDQPKAVSRSARQ